MSEHILAETCANGLAVLTIDRPKALNACNIPMVEAIRKALGAWKDDAAVRAVLLKGSGGRAFCSGGDVKGCREALVADPGSQAPKEQVFQEYNLLFEIQVLQKPSIALAEGVTMGFGLAMASFCRYTIATETTRLAMPENNIGLFPDVGFAYMAGNLPPGVGRLLAVTGAHLLGADDAVRSGLASHAVSGEGAMAQLEAALRAADLSGDPDSAVRTCLEGLAMAPAGGGKLQANAALVEAFARAPGELAGLAEARGALEAEAAAAGSWAAELQAGMPKGCPFSQAVVWSLLSTAEAERGKGGPDARLASALERDFATACRLFYRPDFCEGVRAVLVDKGPAKGKMPAEWQPAAASDISEEEVAAAIAPLPEGERHLGLAA